MLFDRIRYFFYIPNDHDLPSWEIVIGCDDRPVAGSSSSRV